MEGVERDGAAGEYVRLPPKKMHLLRKTMKEMEQDLDPSQFLRVHRSAIVNVDFFDGEL
jgi:two-component system LytT family response regulator